MTATAILPSGVCCPHDSPSIVQVLARSLHAAIARRRKRRRDSRHLRDLSDYQLKDLGLRRSEIDPVAYGQASDHVRMLDLLRR